MEAFKDLLDDHEVIVVYITFVLIQILSHTKLLMSFFFFFFLFPQYVSRNRRKFWGAISCSCSSRFHSLSHPPTRKYSPSIPFFSSLLFFTFFFFPSHLFLSGLASGDIKTSDLPALLIKFVSIQYPSLFPPPPSYFLFFSFLFFSFSGKGALQLFLLFVLA